MLGKGLHYEEDIEHVATRYIGKSVLKMNLMNTMRTV
jgi:hypothetical protein